MPGRRGVRSFLPEDWDPRGPIVLKTRARDNFGNFSYPVYLEYSGQKTFPTRAENHVLHIEGTPGGWYMGTLLQGEREGHFRDNAISIDFGQKWDCINFGEILAEAKRMLKLV